MTNDNPHLDDYLYKKTPLKLNANQVKKLSQHFVSRTTKT